MLHGTWSSSTDAYGIYRYAYQFWYKDSNGTKHNLGQLTNTTDLQATYQFNDDYENSGKPYLTTTSAKTYGIAIYAIDNAMNSSSVVDSATVECKRVKVGFCYGWCYSTSSYSFKDEIDSFITNVVNSNIEYVKMYSRVPDDTYDVLIIALPNATATGSELTSISSWLKRWHRRVILVGDNGAQMSTQNGRLNSIVTGVGIFSVSVFATSGYIFSGIDTTRYLMVNTSTCLTRSVDYLLCASASASNGLGSWVANGDTWVYNPGYTWIIETNVSPSGHAVLIHDEGLFLNNYHRYGQDNFVRNICSVFE